MQPPPRFVFWALKTLNPGHCLKTWVSSDSERFRVHFPASYVSLPKCQLFKTFPVNSPRFTDMFYPYFPIFDPTNFHINQWTFSKLPLINISPKKSLAFPTNFDGSHPTSSSLPCLEQPEIGSVPKRRVWVVLFPKKSPRFRRSNNEGKPRSLKR